MCVELLSVDVLWVADLRLRRLKVSGGHRILHQLELLELLLISLVLLLQLLYHLKSILQLLACLEDLLLVLGLELIDVLHFRELFRRHWHAPAPLLLGSYDHRSLYSGPFCL